jgi:hypothetical protein
MGQNEFHRLIVSPIVPHEKHLLPLLGFDPQTIQFIVKSSMN